MTDKYIVITSSFKEQENFSQQIEKLGLQVFQSPAIQIKKSRLSENAKTILDQIDQFDWILFTSKFGVQFFLEAINELGLDPSKLKSKKIGVVGPKTAEKVKKCNLSVDFMPSQFTSEDLGRQLPDVYDKKILLPRSNMASKLLVKILKERGARIVNLSIYSTEYITKSDNKFEKLVMGNQISCITFASPSAVKGLLKGFKNKSKILLIPIFAIGPVTAKAATQAGFKSVHIADIFTAEAIIKKIKKIV